MIGYRYITGRSDCGFRLHMQRESWGCDPSHMPTQTPLFYRTKALHFWLPPSYNHPLLMEITTHAPNLAKSCRPPFCPLIVSRCFEFVQPFQTQKKAFLTILRVLFTRHTLLRTERSVGCRSVGRFHAFDAWDLMSRYLCSVFLMNNGTVIVVVVVVIIVFIFHVVFLTVIKPVSPTCLGRHM